MKTLRELLDEYKKKNKAVPHFNVSDLAQLYGVINAVKKNNLPVIIGVSEGEREFWGVKQISALIKSIRNEYGIDIFLNADHTHSLDKAIYAVESGFDSVIYDASKKDISENIKETKQFVDFVKNYNLEHNTDVLVEGEIGYIGSGSEILEEMPKGASIKESDLTTVDMAVDFVEKTGIDLLAPAVGNIHGMFKNAPNPNLDIDRIKNISSAVKQNLVLHGGSGIKNEQLIEAIHAGIRIIHISTFIRVAWRKALDLSLLSKPNEVAPYKIFSDVKDEVENAVESILHIFI